MVTNIAGIKYVCNFLKQCDYYMLATMDGDQPRVRPFGTIHIFEEKLYIQTLHHKRTAQQLAQNAKAEICAMNKEGNMWIRVCGTLIDDPRVEAKRSMLNAYPFLRTEYDENSPETAVYYFTNATAWISKEGEEDREIEF